jgi:hypothetical protein
MNTVIQNRTDRLVAAILAIALLAALAGQAITTAPTSAQDVSEVPLDLAAIALTPADLEAEGHAGYGSGVSVLGDPETAAQFLIYWREDPEGALTDGLVAADPSRVHMLYMGLPLQEADPTSLTLRSVFTYVLEFPDPAEAATGLERLADGWATGNATPEQTTSTVGDDRRFFRDQGSDPGTGNPYIRADLLFTYDRLVLGVSFQDAAGDLPGEAVLDSLANRLAARAQAGLAGEAAGLSNLVARIGAQDEPDPWDVDRYGAMDGMVLKQRNDSPEAFQDRQAIHDQFGIIDYYFVNQPLGGVASDADSNYSNGLRTFESEAQADAWQVDAIDRLIERGASNLEKMADPPALGDATIVHSYDIEVEGRMMSFWRVDIRVGTTMSTWFLRGSTLPPWEAVEEIASAQADCLTQSVCLEPISLPSALGDAAWTTETSVTF